MFVQRGAIFALTTLISLLLSTAHAQGPCRLGTSQLLSNATFVTIERTNASRFGLQSGTANGPPRLWDTDISDDVQFSCQPPCAWSMEFSFSSLVTIDSIHTYDHGSGLLSAARKLADSDSAWSPRVVDEASPCCGTVMTLTLGRRGPTFTPFTAKRVQINVTSFGTEAWMDVIEMYVCGAVATTTTTTTTTPVTTTTTTSTTTTTTTSRPGTTSSGVVPSTTSTTPTTSSTTSSFATTTTTMMMMSPADSTTGDSATTTAAQGNSDATNSPESGTITLIIIICASVGGCIVVGGIMVIIGCCVLKPKDKVNSAYPTMGYSSQQSNFVPMDTMSVPQISDSPYQKTAGAYFPESSAGGTGDIYGVPNFDAAAKDASYTMFAGDSTARGTLQRTYTVPDLPNDPHEKPNY